MKAYRRTFTRSMIMRRRTAQNHVTPSIARHSDHSRMNYPVPPFTDSPEQRVQCKALRPVQDDAHHLHAICCELERYGCRAKICLTCRGRVRRPIRDSELAGDAPRIQHEGSTSPEAQAPPMADGGWVDLESGFPYETVRGLMQKGHSVRFAHGPYGGYQAIEWDAKNRVYVGASEGRKDGQAAGY